MAQDLKAAEGRVEVPGGRVRVRDKIAGSGPGLPPVTVHGGPGASHDYPEPWEEPAASRPVLFHVVIRTVTMHPWRQGPGHCRHGPDPLIPHSCRV